VPGLLHGLASAVFGAALLWFGAAGTLTPLHHDTLMLLHTQLVGRKRWRLASPLQTPRLYNTRSVFSPVDLAAPDLARFPRLAGVQVFDVVLGPGETLFVPLGWWHQVEALDTSLSISFTNLDVRATRIRIKATALHEGDMLGFLNELALPRRGYFTSRFRRSASNCSTVLASPGTQSPAGNSRDLTDSFSMACHSSAIWCSWPDALSIRPFMATDIGSSPCVTP
jgi:hypothetical protein